jgi:hypothetical protein
MFWRKLKDARDRKDAWDQKQKKLYYESAIRTVYVDQRIRLALARINYMVGHNVIVVPGDPVLESPRAFNLRGVVHWWGSSDFHIQCDLEFEDDNVRDGVIGRCELAHDFPKKGERIEERPMMLDVKIYDPAKKYRYIAYDAMRDAAISGNRFFHIEMKTDCVDEAEAIRSMREKEYGPQLQIFHLRMFPEIILPNAPTWGWKRSYDRD